MENTLNTSGFYKKQNNELLYAENWVQTPSNFIHRENLGNLSLPIEGWYFFDSREEAVAYLLSESSNITEWELFLASYLNVSGIHLKASYEARNAFIGQSALMKEGLDLGYMSNDSIVGIWDIYNIEHKMTVSQCRQLLFLYGVKWKEKFDELAP